MELQRNSKGQYVVSQSMLGTFMRCPTEAVLAYHRRASPKVRSIALQRGTMVHSVLEHYYSRVADDPAAALREAANETQQGQLKLPPETGQVFYEVLSGYFWHWGEHDYKPIQPEVSFEVELTEDIVLKGQIDLIAEDDEGEVILVDHKTHATLPDLMYRLANHQAPLYVWAAQQMGLPVSTFEWNYMLWKPRGRLKQLKDGTLGMTGRTTVDYTSAYHQLQQMDGVTGHEEWLAGLKKQRGNRSGQFYRRTQLCYSRDQLERWKERAIRAAEAMIDYDPNGPVEVTQDCGGRMCQFKSLIQQAISGADRITIDESEYTVKEDLFDYYQGRGDSGNNPGNR